MGLESMESRSRIRGLTDKFQRKQSAALFVRLNCSYRAFVQHFLKTPCVAGDKPISLIIAMSSIALANLQREVGRGDRSNRAVRNSLISHYRLKSALIRGDVLHNSPVSHKS